MKIKLNKNQWKEIGTKTGWIKKAGYTEGNEPQPIFDTPYQDRMDPINNEKSREYIEKIWTAQEKYRYITEIYKLLDDYEIMGRSDLSKLSIDDLENLWFGIKETINKSINDNA